MNSLYGVNVDDVGHVIIESGVDERLVGCDSSRTRPVRGSTGAKRRS
jgi:hypothetical protein